MNIALVHDYLNQYGGAERVLETLCEIFPDAPIYTLFYDEEETLGKFKGKKIITSFLDYKFVRNNHRLFIPLMPLAIFLMKVDKKFNMVLSASAGFAKGIRYEKNTIHISYCYTPLRYAWEYYKYFNWKPFLKTLSAPLFWYLRKWDRWAGRKPQKLITVSEHIAKKIKDYYERKADVIYPPVDTSKFTLNEKIKKGDYFLAVGRMMHYKKFDLIIKAFNKLNLPLLIVGIGPELNKLKNITTSSNIKFLSFVSNEQLNFLYNGAQALIFPQIEDFGLVAAEAQACGTPIIALNRGGAREIVKDGQTGVFFDNQSIDDLIMAVKKFQIKKFNRENIRKSALRFSKNRFKKEILKILARY
ncbi:glycosyltransferase [Patescibacteria group bacterium]|nr:glycosyltransferase [Patescibacteria group bacterium]